MSKELTSVARTTSYPPEAFEFVQRGLEYTVTRLHKPLGPAKLGPSPTTADPSAVDDDGTSDATGETAGDATVSRHITGQALCEGLRLYAIGQYGLMARAVLQRWQITSCHDFGCIVFAMIDAGMMHKTPEDSLGDFDNVFDFANAFATTLSLADS